MKLKELLIKLGTMNPELEVVLLNSEDTTLFKAETILVLRDQQAYYGAYNTTGTAVIVID